MRMYYCNSLVLALLLGSSAALGQTAQTPPSLTAANVIGKVSPSVALILVGEGGGRLTGIGSGLIVRSDGVLLTAYHVIKDAAEVQVRLKNGEIYDRTVLIGFDERRDVAALRISARDLPVLATARIEDAKPGDQTFVVSHPGALSWTASAGILSASRLADEVPGAGTGFRVLQFTAPISPGSSGGALVDDQGRVLGIVIGSSQGQNLNFAVPIESVLGLADGSGKTALGTGSALHLPETERAPAAASVAEVKAADVISGAQTVIIQSHSSLFPVDPVEKELLKRPDFHYRLVNDYRLADLVVQLDRPLFTWDFTFKVIHRQTSIVLAAGKVFAWDGVRAAPEIAKQIIQQLAAKLREAEIQRKKP